MPPRQSAPGLILIIHFPLILGSAFYSSPSTSPLLHLLYFQLLLHFPSKLVVFVTSMKLLLLDSLFGAFNNMLLMFPNYYPLFFSFFFNLWL